MRTVRIDFTSTKLLPDGNSLGFIGEHNATRLKIIPPKEMSDCEEIQTYVAAFAVCGKVFYSDAFSKDSEIIIPLSQNLTKDYFFAVQLEGYDENGNLIVKSPLVSALKFSPSARGTGNEIDAGKADNSDGSPVSHADHTHENKQVLDLLGSSGGSLTFGGNSVGGVSLKSNYYENDFTSGIILNDFFSSNDICFLISEDLPENSIITGISVLWKTDEGTKEYSPLGLIANSLLSPASTITVAEKPELLPDYDGFYIVGSFSKFNVSDSKLYEDIIFSNGKAVGFKVNYMQV